MQRKPKGDEVMVKHTPLVLGIYVRNSTPSQVGNFRSEVQLDELVSLVSEHGYSYQLYEEQGTSGKDIEHRPVFQRMLHDLQQGGLAGVAALDIKRATRDRDGLDGRTLKRIIRKLGGILLTRHKTFDFRQKADSRLFDIEAMVAGWDWEDIAETTWDGIMKRAASEPMLRRKPPVGYKLLVKGYHKDGRPIRVPAKHEEDAALAEEVWQRLVTTPPEELARQLNREGNLRPMRESLGNLKGRRHWYGSDLRNIMRSKLYMGVVEFAANARSPMVQARKAQYASLTHLVPELAYVNVQTWMLVNERYQSTPRTNPREMHAGHPFRRILRCRCCGGPMWGSFRPKEQKVMYYCARAAQGLCRSNTIMEHMAAKAIIPTMANILRSLDTERIINVVRTQDVSRDVRDLEMQLAQVKSKMEEVVSLVLDGVIDRDAARRRTAELQAQRQTLELQLAAIQQETCQEHDVIRTSRLLREDMSRVLWHLSRDKLKFVAETIFEPQSVLVQCEGATTARTSWVSDYTLTKPLSNLLLTTEQTSA